MTMAPGADEILLAGWFPYPLPSATALLLLSHQDTNRGNYTQSWHLAMRAAACSDHGSL